MKQTLRKVLSAMLTCMLCLTLMMPVLAEANAVTLHTLSVDIRLSGDYPRSEDYKIVLKAEDHAYPMPEGSVNGRYEMTITGASSKVFPAITYSEAGTYTYQVWQKEGTDRDGTYDDTVYTVTVYVVHPEGNEEERTLHYVVMDGAAKTNGIVFANKYRYNFIPIIPPPETEPEETDPSETDPVETDPPETDPAETDPTETDPVETEPDETDPVETEPAETDPAETDPVETEPVETDPEETDPVETETEIEPVETEPEPQEEMLVQTGQLNWPVSVLSVGGISFAALGCVLLNEERKRSREDIDGE